MVAHTCHPSAWEVEEGGSNRQGHLSATQQVREQSGLQETVLKQELNTHMECGVEGSTGPLESWGSPWGRGLKALVSRFSASAFLAHSHCLPLWSLLCGHFWSQGQRPQYGFVLRSGGGSCTGAHERMEKSGRVCEPREPQRRIRRPTGGACYWGGNCSLCTSGPERKMALKKNLGLAQ